MNENLQVNIQVSNRGPGAGIPIRKYHSMINQDLGILLLKSQLKLAKILSEIQPKSWLKLTKSAIAKILASGTNRAKFLAIGSPKFQLTFATNMANFRKCCFHTQLFLAKIWAMFCRNLEKFFCVKFQKKKISKTNKTQKFTIFILFLIR